MTNPLLESHRLPPFSSITAADVVPAIEALLAQNRAAIDALLQDLGHQPDWAGLVAPLEEADDRLDQAWSPVSHLNAVTNSDALREAYNHCTVAITEYATEMGQRGDLFDAYRRLADGSAYAALDRAQRKTVDNALRDFRLAGVSLPAAEKRRFSDIKARLSALSSRFANNVLDATQAWYKPVADVADLAGLPQTALAAAAAAAAGKGLGGYVITLEAPAYTAVMTHADDRRLRREVYTAYNTRASELGRTAGGEAAPQWDNAALIDETLALRHELAQLLGFANYAEYSLATKMAQSTAQVMDFLQQLAEKSRPYAEAEYAELQAFARRCDAIDSLEAWDISYYSEKLRQQKYAVSQEALRPYFPLEKVLEGLFAISGQLFDIDVRPETGADTWHPDVRFYRVSRDGEPLAYCYMDLFARENKRGGAWMGECRVRRRSEAGLQLPVAYLTCNFSPPLEDKPSLLTHDEVTTLFHEFGHGLHHMLTQIESAAVSGINGVAWDAVELPSQFLENWCWQKSTLAMISAHYQSGEPLPDDLLQRMLAAKHFQAGMQMLRQLELALFDFHLHCDYRPESPQPVQQVLDQVRQRVAVLVPPAFNRFQNGFSHIFAGGYAAGYYSYKWAEVLSSDAFGLFEERGVLDGASGRRFLHEILEQGGAEDAMQLFVSFRGRQPRLDALLRHSGMAP